MSLSALVVALLAVQAEPAPRETLLFDFESPNQAFESANQMEYVSEHVTQGKRAGKVRLDRPFAPNIFFFGGSNQVGKWGDYDRLVFDVFVDGGAVTASGFIVDKEGRDWWKRHNYEFRLRPGAGSLTFSLGSLARSNGQGNIDLASISTVALQFSGDNSASPPTLYLDNGRLVKGAREIPVAGLRKFAFGPAKGAIVPGFTRVTSGTGYDPASGFGWLAGGQFGRDFDMDEMLGRHRPPDDLGRHFSMPLRAVFAIDLPDGRYGAWLLLGPAGNGWGPSFRHRSVTANGTTVVDQSFDLKSFRAHEFAFQDEEDLPGDDLWEKYIHKLFVPQRFDVVVSGHQLKLDFNSYGAPWCAMVNGLVVWPKASEPDAERWLAALDAARREQFNLYHAEKLPPAPSPYLASEADRTRGFVTFVHAPDREVAVNSVPTPAEARRTSIDVAGSPGETVLACLGVLPLKNAGAITTSKLLLRNAAASEIAGRVRVARYKALNHTATYEIAPKYLDDVDVQPVSLRPGVTRSFWGTIAIPSDAPAGEYAGEWILSGGTTRISVPVRLRVWPIRLEEVPVPMGMFGMSPTGSSWGFEPQGEAYWAAWKELLEDARRHGLTGIDPAIHIPLLRISGGKAEIDFREADRFMELARAAGFTRELNGYSIDTGLAIRVNPGFDPTAEARRWGVATYAEAVRAYFDAIRVHAKEKNWLPIAFCTDDEYLIHPGGDPVKLATQHRLLRENAPGFHFVAFDSAMLGGADHAAKESMLADLDIWAPGLHGPKDAELIHAANRTLWLYNTGLNRFTFGSYLFYARQRYGVQGFFQWIYNGGGTYSDFYLASHNESHYGVTYPSNRGLRSTPTWERILLGMNDHRYLETARRAIEEGKGKPAAAALQKTIDELFAKLHFGKADADAIAGDGKAENPTSPESMDAFRRSLAEGILNVRGSTK